jgi:hypothetical protein
LSGKGFCALARPDKIQTVIIDKKKMLFSYFILPYLQVLKYDAKLNQEVLLK